MHTIIRAALALTIMSASTLPALADTVPTRNEQAEIAKLFAEHPAATLPYVDQILDNYLLPGATDMTFSTTYLLGRETTGGDRDCRMFVSIAQPKAAGDKPTVDFFDACKDGRQITKTTSVIGAPLIAPISSTTH